MKRGVVVLSFCLVSGLMLVSCQRDNSVHAGNDNDTYLPRPAAKRNLANIANEAVVGELVQVDSKKKTFVVRVDNGMEQTFKFDPGTSVAGLQNVQTPMRQKPGNMNNPGNNPGIQNLIGKEGSEVTVEWRSAGEAKMATHVDVTQVSTSKSQRRGRKKH